MEKSKRKPNKLWVDQGKEFYKQHMFKNLKVKIYYKKMKMDNIKIKFIPCLTLIKPID